MITMSAVDTKNANVTLLAIRYYNFYFIKLFPFLIPECNRWVEKMAWNEQKACFFIATIIVRLLQLVLSNKCLC